MKQEKKGEVRKKNEKTKTLAHELLIVMQSYQEQNH
jgi:hypothetical protein